MKTSKRLLIIAIFTFYVLGFFMLFNNKVSAKELSQFCDYTEPCLSEELIEEIITYKNVDTSVYDSYFITINNTKAMLYLWFYSSANPIISSYSYVDSSDNSLFLQNVNYKSSHYSFNLKTLNSNNKFTVDKYYVSGNLSTSMPNLKVLYENNQYIYYSNQDILDKNGNILLAKNNIELIPEEPEEEPITIINKMALLVNDIVVYFNENNISFYQILIGLFIFNFLVYVICYVVRRF